MGLNPPLVHSKYYRVTIVQLSCNYRVTIVQPMSQKSHPKNEYNSTFALFLQQKLNVTIMTQAEH